jgi:uncharacterized membrane protein (DUF373 family)
MTQPESPRLQARNWIARAFTLVEDAVYIGLGLLLAGILVTLLIKSFARFSQSLVEGDLPKNIIGLLDHILLILLIVELLYTVQVSFREHALVPEPFLLVGLISAIRRVLVLTAEFGLRGETQSVAQDGQAKGLTAQDLVIELAVLTVLILILAISFVLLRKRATTDSRV